MSAQDIPLAEQGLAEASDLHKDNGPEVTDYPDGGLQAWGVAIGASGLLFVTLGYSNSFGVFQAYYQQGLLADRSPSTISWIGSIQVFLGMASGLIGGPIFDRVGSIIIWIAGFAYIFSIMMTSLCKELYQFILAQGILGGIAMGMVMTPGMAAVSHYFDKKRAAALGIAIAGSSIGGVVMPIALNKMLLNPALGFGWSVRIIGFIALVVIIPCSAIIRPRLPRRLGTFFIPTAFKELKFVTLLPPVLLLMMGVFIPVFYLPSFAIFFGMNTQLAFYLTPILNAASVFGRVLAGILADKVGAMNMMFIMGLGTSILILCWPVIHSNGVIIFFAGIYGFFSGSIISLLAVCMSQVPKDPKTVGTYMGMGMFVCSLGALASPPINGALIADYGGFSQAAIFSGLVSLVGTFGVLGSKLLTRGVGVAGKA